MHEQVSQGAGCAEYLRAGCGALPARGGGQTWGLKGLAPGKVSVNSQADLRAA